VIPTRLALLVPLILTAAACGPEAAAPPGVATSASSAAALSAGAPAAVASAMSPNAVASGLAASLDETGVSFSVSGKRIGAGCSGEQGVTVPVRRDGAHDFAAVAACARTLKADPRLVDQTALTVSAAPGTRYGDVIGLLDATRVDASGELFPDISFGIPRGSASAPPNAPRGALPAKTLDPVRAEQVEDGVVLRISKTQITVGDDPAPVVEYPGLERVREHGLDAKHKRGGQSDLFIVPLASVLSRYRATDKRIREAKGIEASTSELILVADAEVPYRVLFEVLYTAGQSEFGKYHLLVRQAAP
jgi:hypothetical protein